MLTGTLRRHSRVLVSALVVAVVAFSLILAVGRHTSAASSPSGDVAHFSALTGGKEAAGVPCSVQGNSNAGNIFPITSFKWGMTLTGTSAGSPSGGAGAGGVDMASVVFSAPTDWYTPELETLLVQDKSVNASFCFSLPGSGKAAGLVETYAFSTCAVAGVDSSVASDATDTITLHCANVTHSVSVSQGQPDSFSCVLQGSLCVPG